MNKFRAIIIIAIISVITALLRFIPFLIFRGNKKTPPFIEYLGQVLPFAIIGMLVVYCLKNVSVFSSPYGIPELISIMVVVFAHGWKRNTLLSIISGTLSYVLLVNFVV